MLKRLATTLVGMLMGMPSITAASGEPQKPLRVTLAVDTTHDAGRVDNRADGLVAMATPALWLRHTSAAAWNNALINFDSTDWSPSAQLRGDETVARPGCPHAACDRRRSGPRECRGDPLQRWAEAVLEGGQPLRAGCRGPSRAASPFKPVGAMLKLVTPDDLKAQNTLALPAAVRVVPGSVELVQGRVEFTLPRWSIAVVEMAADSTPHVPAHKAGDPMTVDLGGVKLELVWIPPGKFTMGSPLSEKGRFRNEGPQHEVTISKGFWMGKYTVTQAQWEKVMGNNPSKFKKSGADAPVETVSIEQCREFIGKLNKGGLVPDAEFKLPTEAQWEYSCRAGMTTRYYSGDKEEDLDRVAWYGGNSRGQTHPVGQKAPNAFGLYDMHGNVWQWCRDWNDPYPSTAVTDPEGPSAAEFEVLRGGSWFGGFKPETCRSAFRLVYKSARPAHHEYIGFRVMLLSR